MGSGGRVLKVTDGGRQVSPRGEHGTVRVHVRRRQTIASLPHLFSPHRAYQARYAAGLKAKEMLLKSNYRLVMAVCKKYLGNAANGLQMQDLVSEGVKGLLRSVEKYDASKGFRFGTYAHWWIRQAVSRSLQETGRAVR